jgi:hypothetical protein
MVQDDHPAPRRQRRRKGRGSLSAGARPGG